MSPSVKRGKNPLVPPYIDADTARVITSDTSLWFDEFKRSLNFRATRDPYAVMVSEFMLQQTTVATVEAYFERFMAKFPTVLALALASEDDVLTMWAGLGYYRRARQLHLAAKQVVNEHDGEIPRDPALLQALPGIGRYTAGAIASIAFNRAAPILEANTVRVFARVAGLVGTVGGKDFMAALWQVAVDLVSQADEAGKFNTAAMELGSLVCRPVPLCLSCPLTENCRAFIGGFADTTPAIAPARPTVPVGIVCLVLSRKSEYLLRRIPQGEWHAGMWEFPTYRIPAEISPEEATGVAAAHYGIALQDISFVTRLQYQVTHHKISCHVFRAALAEKSTAELSDQQNWQIFSLADISSLPMGSAQKKLLKVLSK